VLAVIGGSGLYELDHFDLEREAHLLTEYGEASAAVQLGQWHGTEIAFLARHGAQHHLAPHEVNYRANIQVLSDLGVDEIVAINAVGGINPNLSTGTLVVPDQLIDYTSGRLQSFFTDGTTGGFDQRAHIDFSYPFDETLRQVILQAAQKANIQIVDAGVTAVTQGPRLETAAEIRRLAGDGCDLVGMTSMPEAGLAREKAIAYACIALVVNPAAGLSDEEITIDDIHRVMKKGIGQILKIVELL